MLKQAGAKSLLVAVVWLLALCRMTSAAHAQITIDDHVRRGQIVVAALAPDGRTAAYAVARANPIKDVYELSVRSLDTRSQSVPITLAQFELSPAEAFHEHSGGFLRSGADLRWVSDDVLVFTRTTAGKSRLEAWNRKSNSSRVLMEGHDRVELVDADSHGLAVLTKDFRAQPESRESVPDHSLRILDDYRFHGPLKNPALSRWTRTQRWTVSLEREPVIAAVGPSMEDWESHPPQWTRAPADSGAEMQESADRRTYRTNAIRSPDGSLSVASEYTRSNLLEPGAAWASVGLALQEEGARRTLVPHDRSLISASVIGWRPDSKAVFYIASAAKATAVNIVSLDGKVRNLYSAPALLEVPGFSSAPRSQVLSQDGRTALLVRSTNTMPAELVKLDLRSGALTVLESPEAGFAQRADVTVRFYPIKAAGGQAWGRLYLPRDYSNERRLPLLITQYVSTPGYYASVGDEIPILPLVALGIPVFAMHSATLNNTSSVGDFRLEIDRVEQPLKGMEEIVQRLAAEGIVDPQRVALSGLSYGAEIASYAYWKSQLFRAVSVATTAWDPNLMGFGGVGYGAFLDRRGFPRIDAAGIEKWRDLAPGPNARSNLPPLLIQSPDGEQNITVPTWMQLRRAGAPVEWLEYPNEGHVKRGPANKRWVFQRNLDWFRFWLQSHEDPDPAKAEQYARWRQMRSEPGRRDSHEKPH